MLQEDFEKCENIHSMYIGYKKSPIESLCEYFSQMSVYEIIEQVNRMAVEKYFSAKLNNRHL